ncbi:MAG: hypothetical protein QXT73_07540 [Candidatus Methanomethylicaceae archaeon]
MPSRQLLETGVDLWAFLYIPALGQGLLDFRFPYLCRDLGGADAVPAQPLFVIVEFTQAGEPGQGKAALLAGLLFLTAQPLSLRTIN